MQKVGEINQSAIKWIATETYIFDDGSLIGKVLAEGTEAEIDKLVARYAQYPTASAINLPKSWMNKKVAGIFFHAMAVNKECKIHKVIKGASDEN